MNRGLGTLLLGCNIGDISKSRSKVTQRWGRWALGWMGSGYLGTWNGGGICLFERRICWMSSRGLWIPYKSQMLKIFGSRNMMLSVESAYSVLELASRVDVVPPEVSGLILVKVWKSWAPSKVSVFFWELLHNTIPSRQNFFRRRVIITCINNSLCVLFGYSIESGEHMFLTSKVCRTLFLGG
jgi:hypothetical protein